MLQNTEGHTHRVIHKCLRVMLLGRDGSAGDAEERRRREQHNSVGWIISRQLLALMS